MTDYLIITDLDGTLLDASTYSSGAAEKALALVRRKSVPLVICSSKTRAEIELYRARLENTDPFIVENGGAVFIPEGYFGFDTGGRREDGYEVVVLGTPYEDLRKALKDIRERTGMEATGFADMGLRELAVASGLSTEEAERARRREFDEPFTLGPGVSERVFMAAIEEAGLRWTRGGRFYHILGDNDKGTAVKALKALYKRAGREVTMVGIGDSPNDLPMLKAVDIPVAVQHEGGTYDSIILDELPDIIRAPGVGPSGWNSFIIELLRDDERKAR